MEDFLIGNFKTDSERKSDYQRKNYFKLVDGENIYRILPPMHSLAKMNRYYSYWRIHFGFKGSDGKMRTLVCLEQKDYKTGVIKEHCPVCDLVSERKKTYEKLKSVHEQDAKKVTKEQLSEYYSTKIASIDGNGKYYVNAVDANGALGVLALPKTVKDDFERLVEKLKKTEGIDAAGVNGIYFSISRSGKFRNTSYSVTPLLVQDPANPKSRMYKEHVIDAEFVARLKKESYDLAKLYTPVSREDLAELASASEDERPKVVDRLFSRAKTEEATASSDTVSLAGTGASGVVDVSVDNNLEVKVTKPSQPKEAAKPANSEVKKAVQAADLEMSIADPEDKLDISSMNDDDFAALLKETI